MTETHRTVRDEIARALAGGAPEGLDADAIAGMLERPPDPAMGDYALPCFRLAKQLKAPPPKIAAEFAAAVKPGGMVASVESAGPFVNVRIDRGAAAALVVGRVLVEGAACGSSDAGAGRTVVIEYSSPNIAKPFSIGHLRSTILGHALAELHEALGYSVVRINFPGDWGTQFGLMVTAFRRWGNEAELAGKGVNYLVGLYVRANAEAKTDPTIDEDARAAFRELESGGAEARRIWESFRSASLEEFAAIYSRLGVRFDVTTGEAFHNAGLEPVVERFRSAGLAVESQGALVVEVDPSEGGMPPCMLRKSDGGSTYATRDLAAAIHRAGEYGFDRMLYVVGADQKLHFRQVFRALELLGMDWASRCVHVDFGLVRFGSGKMSTRQGNVVLLDEVIGRAVELARSIIDEKSPDLPGKESAAEAVGVGAVKFADLCRKRSKDVTFEWDEILRFDGETGPYLQYTHARLASVLRRAGLDPAAAPEGADLTLLVEEEEASAVMLLEGFGPRVADAAENCEPYLLAGYLIELAAAMNRFYNVHRVIDSEPGLKLARLALAWAAKTVLREGLRMLGIEALEEM